MPKGEATALADALASVLVSRETAAAYGAAGRARVLERFPLDRCIVETERYLLSVRRPV